MTTEKLQCVWLPQTLLIANSHLVAEAVEKATEPTFREYLGELNRRLRFVLEKGVVPPSERPSYPWWPKQYYADLDKP